MWFLPPWWVVLGWRFITGQHLDGKARRNIRSGKVKPQFRDIYWNRIGRPRRAGWRLLTFGVLAGTLIGGFEDWWLTRFVLLAVSPFLALFVCRNLWNRLARKVTSYNSDGSPEVYWTLRPKWAKRIRRIREFRFRPLRQPEGEVIRPESTESRAVLAEMAEDSLDPVTGLRRMLETEAAPKDGRARTMARRAPRRR